jgi:putative SOS response-associated peptidase YedK
MLEVDEVESPQLPISWNVAPTQPVYAVATSSGGARRLRALRWGLVPSWAKDGRIGARMINARAETLAKRPAFRALITGRRALLPVSGFYEWRRSQAGDQRGEQEAEHPGEQEGQHAGQQAAEHRGDQPGPQAGAPAPKQPYYFHRADGQPLVLAGLWDLWRDAEGHPLRSCTIITTTANRTMAPVHHRMPVVIAPEAWEEWLRPGPLHWSRLGELLAPAADDLLDAYPVATAVNQAANDGPELIIPISIGDDQYKQKSL